MLGRRFKLTAGVYQLFAIIFIVMFVVAFSEARPPIRREFFKAYPSATNTRLDNVPSNLGHCGLCHYDFDGGGARNPYGLAIEATSNQDKDDILSLGPFDWDLDGKTNNEEILDDGTFDNTPTFPGLSATNIGSVSGVVIGEIQNNLTPSSGGPDTTPPVVTVTFPNGGQSLPPNAQTTITWTATDDSGIAGVDIYVSYETVPDFRVLALGIANTGSFNWYVAHRPTSDALIKIVAIDNAFNIAEDQSDGVFTVEQLVYSAGQAPTTLRDFDMPGSQPFEAGTLQDPSGCVACHADYDTAVEPYANWSGSMMSQASLDPIFKANMVIANQDAPDSGDLCLRCHFPRGWLQGRSIPTDGSAMLTEDESGVSCEFCHRMVDPVAAPENPVEDDDILASLSFPGTEFGNGMYVIDPYGLRRGPFLDAMSGHTAVYSPFHQEAAFCGTCHDVSNPAFEKDGGGGYTPNAFDATATDFSPLNLLPVERTYSEWLNSAYNSPGGVYSPTFGGNKTFVSTCQDCHMRDVTGVGANFGSPPVRDDLPLHDMTGGSAWLTEVLPVMYPGQFDASEIDALNAGAARSRALLAGAASISTSQLNDELTVTVINNTGHKLPTGYPEGRRMWINVKFYDDSPTLISESGAYNASTGVLTEDSEIKIYDIHPGISTSLASILGITAGESFHFVLNDMVVKDNRIPPQGFTNAAFDEFGGSPVGHTYEDGQFWDDTVYTIPAGATSFEVKLYYQSTSKEFIEFLRDENTTPGSTAGQDIYDLWNDNGKCPPELMTQDTAALTPMVADFDGDWNVDGNDLNTFLAAWMASDTDGNWNAACNLEDTDLVIDAKDFGIFSANWQMGL